MPDIDQIIAETNQARAGKGLRPLAQDRRLTIAAQRYAELMAAKDRLGHFLDRTPSARVTDVEYEWVEVAENVAFNYGLAGVVRGWLASPGHYRNIMNRSIREIGVGIGVNSKGEPYYCQVFGAEY